MTEVNEEPVISPHTNRVVISIERPPIFWCGLCKVKLVSPTAAIQHICGRSHKFKTGDNKQPFQSEATKRKGIIPDTIAKRRKDEVSHNIPDKSLSECVDCNIKFSNATNAKWHFRGKWHVGVMAKKLVCSPPSNNINQRASLAPKKTVAPVSSDASKSAPGIKRFVASVTTDTATSKIATTKTIYRGTAATSQTVSQDTGGDIIIAGTKTPVTKERAIIPGGKTKWKDYFVTATETKDVSIKMFESKNEKSVSNQNSSATYNSSNATYTTYNNYNNYLLPTYNPFTTLPLQYGFYGYPANYGMLQSNDYTPQLEIRPQVSTDRYPYEHEQENVDYYHEDSSRYYKPENEYGYLSHRAPNPQSDQSQGYYTDSYMKSKKSKELPAEDTYGSSSYSHEMDIYDPYYNSPTHSRNGEYQSNDRSVSRSQYNEQDYYDNDNVRYSEQYTSGDVYEHQTNHSTRRNTHDYSSILKNKTPNNPGITNKYSIPSYHKYFVHASNS